MLGGAGAPLSGGRSSRWPAAPLAGLLLRGALALGPPGAAAPAATCDSSEDTDHTGGDLRSVGVSSGADCCQECAEDERCAVAVYYGGACYLKGPGSADGALGAGRVAFVPRTHVPSSTGLSPDRPAMTAPFDCQHGYAKWERGWSDEKKAWCCERYEVGCAAGSSNPSKPVDCESAGASVGCAAGSSASSEPFDCDSAGASVEEQWTMDQQVWCCMHRRKGCVFDCAAGVDKWQRGWSQDKKAWCCALEDVSCAHNCSDSFDNWEETWTIEKKSWCCKFKHRGCVLAKKIPSTPPGTAVADNISALVARTTCVFEEGIDYRGGDIAAMSPVNSKDGCCSACANHPGCTVAVLSEGRCYLKDFTAGDKVASEGRTACARAVDAGVGNVQALSNTGGPVGDPAPGGAEAPGSGETQRAAPSSVHAAPDEVSEDLALYNCDDPEVEGWSPPKGDFCCESEGKGCPPAGAQGASSVLGSSAVGRVSSQLARPSRAASLAAGAASVAAALLSIGCCYRRGPQLQRGTSCSALGWLPRRGPMLDFFGSALARAERSSDGYTELRLADADAPTSTAGCL